MSAGMAVKVVRLNRRAPGPDDIQKLAECGMGGRTKWLVPAQSSRSLSKQFRYCQFEAAVWPRYLSTNRSPISLIGSAPGRCVSGDIDIHFGRRRGTEFREQWSMTKWSMNFPLARWADW